MKILITFLIVLFSTSIMSSRDINWDRFYNHFPKYYDLIAEKTSIYMDSMYKESQIKPAFLIAALISYESNWRSVVAPDSSIGFAQIHHGPLDPVKSIIAGIRIYSRYKRIFHDDNKALMAYNCGIGKARKMIKRGILSTTYSRAVLSIALRMQEDTCIINKLFNRFHIGVAMFNIKDKVYFIPETTNRQKLQVGTIYAVEEIRPEDNLNKFQYKLYIGDKFVIGRTFSGIDGAIFATIQEALDWFVSDIKNAVVADKSKTVSVMRTFTLHIN